MIGLMRRRKTQPLNPAVIVEFLSKLYYRFGLRRFGMEAILVGYSFIGGALFQYLEEPYANFLAAQVKNDTLQRRDEFALNLTFASRQNCSASTTANATVDECLYKLFYAAVTKHESRLKLDTGGLAYKWDFWNAVFYSATLYTTIGYGHLYCRTFWGRIATIVYACMGIPLVLLILDDLGTLFAGWLKKVWIRVVVTFRQYCCGCCRRKHIAMEQSNQPTPNHQAAEAPLTLAFSILFLYIFVCAAIFKIWETHMDYFTAFYFFFVSLTTIGLGDIVPEHPRFTLIGFGFFLIGLALVSMCINTIQARFERAYENAAERLLERLEHIAGMKDEAADPTNKWDALRQRAERTSQIEPDNSSKNTDSIGRLGPIGQENVDPSQTLSSTIRTAISTEDREDKIDHRLNQSINSSVGDEPTVRRSGHHFHFNSHFHPHVHLELKKHIAELRDHLMRRRKH